MRFLNIIVLVIFINFVALPGIAAVFGWDTPMTTMIVEEEENHNSYSQTIFEKTIPKTLDVLDYIQFTEPEENPSLHFLVNEATYLDPHLTIFSPPPEA